MNESHNNESHSNNNEKIFDNAQAETPIGGPAYADPAGDYLVRATALNDQVRLVGIRSTELCREAMQIHDLSPSATVALGRLMTGVLMLTPDLDKPEHSVTAVIRSDGPIGGLTVVGQSEGRVRGLVLEPHVPTLYREAGKLDISGVVGQGRLTVIRDFGHSEPYVGHVNLVSGEIAEDLTSYLAISEQVPTVMALCVSLDQTGVKYAGGYMMQLLPGAEDTLAERLEARVAGFPDVSELFAQGFNPHHFLDLLMGDPGIKYHDVITCSYDCNCSRERMLRNLIALGSEELGEMSEDPQGVELVCHFCDGKYHFSQEELREILA